MGKIIFGFIHFSKLDKFTQNHKYKNLAANYDLLVERLYIEENNLLNKFGFTTLESAYASKRILNPGVLKLNRITAVYGDDGFLVLGHVKGTTNLVYTAIIANINLSNKIIYKNNNNSNNNKILGNGLLLSSLGINYNYRGLGYCSRILSMIIKKCSKIYKNIAIYSEILSTNTKSQKCHTNAGFIYDDNLTTLSGDDIYVYNKLN